MSCQILLVKICISCDWNRYGKCLRALAKMPADYPYRKHTEQIVTERAAMLKATENIAEIEKKLDCGQIEEVIIQVRLKNC